MVTRSMLARNYGSTGITVSAVGFGAMQIGAPDINEAAAAAMLRGVLDLGVTLIDTARSYGLSEERIGARETMIPCRGLVSCAACV